MAGITRGLQGLLQGAAAAGPAANLDTLFPHSLLCRFRPVIGLLSIPYVLAINLAAAWGQGPLPASLPFFREFVRYADQARHGRARRSGAGNGAPARDGVGESEGRSPSDLYWRQTCD
jgi:hypothetical protein